MLSIWSNKDETGGMNNRENEKNPEKSFFSRALSITNSFPHPITNVLTLILKTDNNHCFSALDNS
jgi:hypothetical protein